MTHSFNRLTTIAALDIGSSKVCCVIAKISRDKRISVVGYGYNASKGIKNGIVTDINQATLSVCNAVETAEQMANERIDRIMAGEDEARKNLFKFMLELSDEDIAALDRLMKKAIRFSKGEIDE